MGPFRFRITLWGNFVYFGVYDIYLATAYYFKSRRLNDGNLLIFYILSVVNYVLISMLANGQFLTL